MKLYLGGAYQGQEELARQENPSAFLLTDFHETIREAMRRGEGTDTIASRILLETPDAVIVANEIGAGIVPIAAEDRAWRETVGRVLCTLAQASESVTRVTCGIGVRLK